MRQYFLTKWVREINLEIEKAKKDQNYLKLTELRWLRDDISKLLDMPNR